MGLPGRSALILTVGLAAGPARADQLACNSEADADRAAALLPPGSILIDYCSLCSDRIEVVRVKAARVVKDCSYELQVVGTLVAASEETFHDRPRRRYRGRARFVQQQAAWAGNLDLAYAYVEVRRNRFAWLGGVLGLQAEVRTEEIRLPKDVYRRLGPHTLLQAPSAAAPPPVGPRLGRLGLSVLRRGALAEATRAIDDGRYAAARDAALRALQDELGGPPRLRPLKNMLSGAGLTKLLERTLEERLAAPYQPLRNIVAGRALMEVEDLEPARLERAVAALAAWAFAHAHDTGRAKSLQAAALALLVDPFTSFDLQRRAPRAAALARFYGAVYGLAVARASGNHDLVVAARRLQQHFEQVQGLRGNYAEVLGRLLGR